MDAKPESKTAATETVSLIVVSILLILTSVGNAQVLLGFSLIAMASLFVWFLTNRKVWLATVAAFVFAATVVVSATKLY